MSFVSVSVSQPPSVTYLLGQLRRSREWVCPRCDQSNLECLPDPPQPSDSSTSDPVREAKTSPETKVAPTAPANVTPSQPPEGGVPVSVRKATPGSVDSTSRSESEDTTTVVVASPPASTPTPSPNLSGARGAHPATGSPASFHPSQSHTTVRPPMLLDTAICVLLVLVFALLLRRIF